MKPPAMNSTISSLDMIKCIKCHHGISCSVWLIGVAMEVSMIAYRKQYQVDVSLKENIQPTHRSNILPETSLCGTFPATGTSGDENQQLPPIQVSLVAQTIARAVEEIVCNALSEGSVTQCNTKHSPQWKKIKDMEVRLQQETEPSGHCDFILVCVVHLMYILCL